MRLSEFARLDEIKKGAKDSNGFSSCWPGKHAEGTKKGKNGKPVRNCVANEANIQPTRAKSGSHISNLSNPTTQSVTHHSSGKEIGLITRQPTGEFYAHPSSTALAHAHGATFATKDEAHQYLRNAHAKAVKNGTLSPRWQKQEKLSQYQGHHQGVKEGGGGQQAAIAIAKKASGKYSKKDGHRLKEGSLADAAKTVKKGALHKQEGIPKDKKIGTSKLKSLKANGTPLEKKRATFALNIQGK